MATNYTTKTAALKATKADINKLDAKKLLLNGKNILDYINDSEFNSYDTRDTQLKNDELDIWNTEISLSEEGHIEVKPLEHTISMDSNTFEPILEGVTESQRNELYRAKKVRDNEVLGGYDNHIMYWQTDGLTNGGYIFSNNLEFTSFSSNLSSLTDGQEMFCSCISLTSFTSDLSSLTDGTAMFCYCKNLNSFTTDLSSLKNGNGMFGSCSSLTSFSSGLPSLTNGNAMFAECSSLTSFTSGLPSLTDGNAMFAVCSSLTSFTSGLPSLTDGTDMFYNCKLDSLSVANIIHSLPTHEESGTISIGIGCDNTEEDQLLFAQECDCETWQELLDEFVAKDWTVTFQCNGRPTTTYGMRRGETLPIYAKLEEVIMPTDEKERKPRYAYTSADGSKFYNINYFHSTNGSTEGYDVFSSLEEAISTYNVTPKN